MSFAQKCLSAFVLLCCWVPAGAQKLRFKQITFEDGLSSNFVRAIYRDQKGFMWFGTQDGLNRYDGYNMQVFRHVPGDSVGLSGSDITCLAGSGEATLYVGTRQGLNRLDLYTGKARTLRSAHGANAITSVMVTDSGQVLAGTEDGVLFLEAGSDSLLHLSFDGAAVPVTCFGVGDGSIFVGTRGHGLWRLGTGRVLQRVALVIPEFMQIAPGALSTITCIRQYSDRIYLGTDGHGIFKVDRSLEVQAHFPLERLPAGARSIKSFEIRNNAVLAATAYGVVVRHLINGDLQHYTRQETVHSLNSNPCNVLFMDQQDNVWVGTDLGGVNVAMSRSQRFPVSTLGFESRLEHVYAFAQGGEQEYFVGGDNLLVHVHPSAGATRLDLQREKIGTVRCLFYEPSGVLWIGTWGGGLLRHDLLRRKTSEVIDPHSGGTILALYHHNGFLFAATAGQGVFRINTASLEAVRMEDQGQLRSVNCFFSDRSGSFWMGTYDGGLVLADDPGTDTVFRIRRIFRSDGRPGRMPSNVVFAVSQSLNGTIWVATSSGLAAMESDSTFFSFSAAQGVPEVPIYAMLRDSTGEFWMTCGRGLVRFRPEGPLDGISFRTYGPRDGLVNTAYNMGAAMADSAGLMYVGGPKGFNVFRPTSVRHNRHPAPVYAVGYRVKGARLEEDTFIAYRKTMEVGYERNNFQLELATLDYTDPENNLFSYYLEGFDASWSDPSTVRFASYSNLPGGTYTFNVKGANNDGIWNEKPWKMVITVVPPFWNTAPFLVLIVMAGIALVIGISSFRTMSVRRENVMLEKKVAERTRELQERNREITSSIEYAKRIQEAILPSRDLIFRKLKKVFILYKPKDIVSGDFYWFAERDGIKIFAVVDCTGHGVPGAFMSMIGHNLLDQVVTELGVTEPGEILNQLHRGVLQALRQGWNEVSTNDGMDVSLLAINDQAREVRWAGANRPLILIDSNGKVDIFKGNKDPVGGAQAHASRTFTTHIIRPEVAAMAYLFTDGYADQFGGDRGKKFMAKRLHEMLSSVHRLNAADQQRALEQQFESWKGEQEQVDDVLIVGIEI